ncbi:MAG: glycerol kinase GlpK [Deltaproteobacteria bacterium]|nr:glycerol kinase GlpK [Deltaproteobacteria bacterium]
MPERFILAVDQGTTSTRLLLVDEQLRLRARRGREFRQIFPRPGWVEHDLDEIWQTTLALIPEVLAEAGIQPRQIAGIGITNQRETTGLWRRGDGKPLHHAIVWQCRRTADTCARLKQQGHEPLYRRRAGLVLDPYFSGTKLRWLLDHLDGAALAAERGELCFGTIDSWLVYKLSGRQAHVTDVTNASRTLLMDLESLAFEPGLLEPLGIPAACLPQIRSSSEVYATTRGVAGLPDGIPIAGIAGDQQAALFGQACFQPGMAKCTYGTGAFVLINLGQRPLASQHGLLTTVAWRIGDQTTYALEGSAFIAGAAVQWLRDGLRAIRSAPEIEGLAASVDDCGEVCFVPALAGLGAPHWRPEARGILVGLSRDSTLGHVARAVLEGVALQIHDILRAMEADARQKLTELRVDGGASQNNLLMQFQADVLDVACVRPADIETTALGAACLAGLAVGMFPDLAAVQRAWRADRRFAPAMGEADRARKLAIWARAVERA